MSLIVESCGFCLSFGDEGIEEKPPTQSVIANWGYKKPLN